MHLPANFDGDLWNQIVVRRVRDDEDMDRVHYLRWRGYKKYFTDRSEVSETLDDAPNAVILLALDAAGLPVGTMRVMDRRFGPIELDAYVDVDRLLPPERHPAADGSRLSVPHAATAFYVKSALWKAGVHYCRDHGIRSILAAIRPGAVPDYRALSFEYLGESGTFKCARFANRRHETWALDLPTAKARHRQDNPLLYRFLHEDEHPNIRYD